MPADDRARTSFVLTCTAYQLKGAMLGFVQGSSIYKLSCKHLTAADMEGLQQAAASNSNVRLILPDGDLVLADIKVELQGEGWTGIEGRLIGTRSGRIG